MNIHERLGARRLSPCAREFYIDGVTYASSASDFQATGSVIYNGEWSKVSGFLGDVTICVMISDNTL